jgi:hypothetical protein
MEHYSATAGSISTGQGTNTLAFFMNNATVATLLRFREIKKVQCDDNILNHR